MEIERHARDAKRLPPFFGQMYGRMSKKMHGDPNSGFSHLTITFNETDGAREQYEVFNSFKNKTLIPFYGTVFAIRVIAAAISQDLGKLMNLGFPQDFLSRMPENTQTKVWFGVRIISALIPVVGTVINGALDAIAQVGMMIKNSGKSTISNKVKPIVTNGNPLFGPYENG